MKPQITVCIPSYCTGSVIRRTIESLRCQRFKEFQVLLGIEPPAEELIKIVQPYLKDPRFIIHINSERLGWDGNIRQLLFKVDTPFFCILSHDDFIHPDYLNALYSGHQEFPDASVVYADMHVFGNRRKYNKFVDIPVNGTKAEQVLAFFQAGAEAVPWRGVTKKTVIENSGGFPVDGFMGFAVECEWALSLLSEGRAVRIPRKLYFKQLHPENITSASKARLVEQDRERLMQAWERHRDRMTDLARASVPVSDPLYEQIMRSVELAMRNRHLKFIGP
jgi:GT2 family glycosyltransferase